MTRRLTPAARRRGAPARRFRELHGDARDVVGASGALHGGARPVQAPVRCAVHAVLHDACVAPRWRGTGAGRLTRQGPWPEPDREGVGGVVIRGDPL